MPTTRNIPFGLSFDDVLLIPDMTLVPSRKVVDVSTFVTRKIRLHLPILSANVPWCTESRMAAAMARVGGLGIIHRMNTPELQAAEVRAVKTTHVALAEHRDATVDDAGRLRVGAAVGVKGDYRRRASLAVENGADLLLVDVAHGHSYQVLKAIELLKKDFPELAIIAGNVATRAGFEALVRAGADAVKVGIGPGGICTTRIVTGCGIPQITAIQD